jgi:hypothetical protein
MENVLVNIGHQTARFYPGDRKNVVWQSLIGMRSKNGTRTRQCITFNP